MELFSAAYVTAIAAAAGVDIQDSNTDDDSVDYTFSSRIAGRPRLDVQLKATYQVADDHTTSVDFPFTLSRKNFDDLRIPIAELVVPRLLIVMLMPEPVEDWLEHGARHMKLQHRAFFRNLRGEPAITTDSKTVRVRWHDQFTTSKLTEMMEYIAINKDLP